MATNLELDDDLIAEAVRLGRHRTKREAVNAALADYVRTLRRPAILDLAGEVEFWPDYDPVALRKPKAHR